MLCSRQSSSPGRQGAHRQGLRVGAKRVYQAVIMASQDVRMYENKYPEVDDVVMVQVRARLSAGRDAARAAAATTPWSSYRLSGSTTLHAAPRRRRNPGPRGGGRTGERRIEASVACIGIARSGPIVVRGPPCGAPASAAAASAIARVGLALQVSRPVAAWRQPLLCRHSSRG